MTQDRKEDGTSSRQPEQRPGSATGEALRGTAGAAPPAAERSRKPDLDLTDDLLADDEISSDDTISDDSDGLQTS